MADDKKPPGGNKPPHLSEKEMQALVAPAIDLAKKLFTQDANEQQLQQALDRFGKTGLVEYLRDGIIEKEFEKWAAEKGIELPDVPSQKMPGKDDGKPSG